MTGVCGKVIKSFWFHVNSSQRTCRARRPGRELVRPGQVARVVPPVAVVPLATRAADVVRPRAVHQLLVAWAAWLTPLPVEGELVHGKAGGGRALRRDGGVALLRRGLSDTAWNGKKFSIQFQLQKGCLDDKHGHIQFLPILFPCPTHLKHNRTVAKRALVVHNCKTPRATTAPRS